MGPGLKIRMDSEKVVIRLGDKSYTVDATFRLTNRGHTLEVPVGFPKRGYGYLGDFEKVSDFINFETWVNGEPAAFKEIGRASTLKATDLTLPAMLERLKSDDPGSLFAEDVRWMVKRVNFIGGKTTTTRVRYEAAYNFFDDGSEFPCGVAHYIYGSGRFWEGKIGKSTFIIEDARTEKGSPLVYFHPRDKPQKKRVSETAVMYTLTNFEPAENAEIVIEPCPSGE